MDQLQVVAAVIIKQGLVLGVKRANHARYNPNRWEFPGGKVEGSESLIAATEREVKEEIGISIIVDQLLKTIQFVNEGRNITLTYFQCHLTNQDPIYLYEHEIFAWFNYQRFNPNNWLEFDNEIFEILKNDQKISF
jgi:8-oxo-dGTP diphosphatase